MAAASRKRLASKSKPVLKSDRPSSTPLRVPPHRPSRKQEAKAVSKVKTKKIIMHNGSKISCYKCITGHRSSFCTHMGARDMYYVRKAGRPVSSCDHDACPLGCANNDPEFACCEHVHCARTNGHVLALKGPPETERSGNPDNANVHVQFSMRSKNSTTASNRKARRLARRIRKRLGIHSKLIYDTKHKLEDSVYAEHLAMALKCREYIRGPGWRRKSQRVVHPPAQQVRQPDEAVSYSQPQSGSLGYSQAGSSTHPPAPPEAWNPNNYEPGPDTASIQYHHEEFTETSLDGLMYGQGDIHAAEQVLVGGGNDMLQQTDGYPPTAFSYFTHPDLRNYSQIGQINANQSHIGFDSFSPQNGVAPELYLSNPNFQQLPSSVGATVSFDSNPIEQTHFGSSAFPQQNPSGPFAGSLFAIPGNSYDEHLSQFNVAATPPQNTAYSQVSLESSYYNMPGNQLGMPHQLFYATPPDLYSSPLLEEGTFDVSQWSNTNQFASDPAMDASESQVPYVDESFLEALGEPLHY